MAYCQNSDSYRVLTYAVPISPLQCFELKRSALKLVTKQRHTVRTTILSVGHGAGDVAEEPELKLGKVIHLKYLWQNS